MRTYTFKGRMYYSTEWEWPYKGESKPMSDKFIKGWIESDLAWLWKLQGEILGLLAGE